MKKLVLYFLLPMFLLSTTELSHLLKVPLLFTHFYSHKKLNKDLAFSDFLSLHYADEGNWVPHDDQDMKLPFKTHDHCALQMGNLFMPSTLFSLVHKKFIQIKLKHNFYVKWRSIPSSYLASIWQPPKSC